MNDSPINLDQKVSIPFNRAIVSFPNPRVKVSLKIEMNTSTLLIRKGDTSTLEIEVQDISLVGSTDIRFAIYSEPTDNPKILSKTGLSFVGSIIFISITQNEADAFVRGNYIGEVAILNTTWKHTTLFVKVEDSGVSHL